MRWLLFLICFTLGFQSLAQTINGIRLTTEKDFQSLSKTTTDYCDATLHYEDLSKTPGDSTLYYDHLCYMFAQKCPDDVIKADATFDFAFELTSHGEYQLAKTYYDEALTQYMVLFDTLYVAKTYKAIGTNYKRMSHYTDALKAFNRASRYFHLVNDEEGIAVIELNIGLIYKSLNRADEAKLKYHSALSRFQELNNYELVADCQNNLGNVFKNEENYDSAFHYMYLTLPNRIKHGPERKLGFIYHNLASLHMRTNNLDSAEWYLNKSITIKKRLGYRKDLSSDYFVYGDLYRRRNDLERSIWAYEKSRELNLELNHVDFDYEVSFELAKNYYILGDYKKAAENYTLYFSQRDSLRLNNDPFQIEAELLQYEFHKDSIETEKLKIERELQEVKYKNQQLSDQSIQSQLYFTVGILSLLVLMLGLLFISFRKRLKQTREHREILAEQNDELKRTLVSKEEKETLLKEIHHRVKNNLQIISSLVRLQSGYIDKTNFKERLNEIENRISSMALVHEKLYQSNDLSKLEVKSYIRDLSINILESYQTRKKVKFIFDIDSSEFNIDTLIPIGLILNETISNALKHAFEELEEGIITIQVKSTARGETTMLIKDNGIGADLSVDELKEDSLGMDLIFSLTEQLDGTLDVNTQNGFEYRFTFPLLV